MSKYNLMPNRNEPPPLRARYREAWQKKLTSLLGMNPYGQPKLRLVWGQEVTHFRYEEMQLRYRRCREAVFDGWYEYGPNEDGKVVWLAHHKPAASKPVVPEGHSLEARGRWVTLGVDRWFIELWKGPKTFAGDPIAWEMMRYKFLYDPAIGVNRKVDVYGPYPAQGGYVKSPFAWPWMIARHAENINGRIACCDERHARGLACFGEYRAPEQRDIDYIAYLIKEKDAEPYKYGYDEVAPAEVVAQDLRDDFTEQMQKAQSATDEESYKRRRLIDKLQRQPVYFDIRRNV